ncbi:hypothetical protein A3H80_01240 [Candidatus Roizmanbacteria bacterium RIFCSPLOWO2_02_FULL_37_19]|uniref:Uncharacterized protein n=1 Tax=Candidatus Roizmanbacteria bacterium RIFCSPHIGHO2_02_FULL_37_24 TaxID=1802037 RepID=A0A1F7GUP9_9BACT|nr:MAG: hypothetical protein A2862_00560 [Candidatus Roizmanbacteria bacterium RIFCSPHIGHO2_01_FULL_38_41]OGK22561.1 MAG: hypothetical protein A3C24_05360 [Candidatus Roizmanbacteria bacterium RIFCSPHIGHO2_02_FULL_37_24]OGK32716.1 MAG: hypothetical protein A3E10_00325 [Candidatus Roizmanbacteria bacterium RIFCSPHIGHO2_12_FULL_37_23]OGK45271.1 MAG: hypothetical protein A2956_01940 [Candidatus Roizmanbacteria bacterium RIFCSPLOWO2_01_FULL_37_57]OGK54224.1 MAG: hypothetical protein A3H80_01240 [Ca
MAKKKSSTDNTTAIAGLLVLVSIILGAAFFALMQRYNEAQLIEKQLEVDQAYTELMNSPKVQVPSEN